MAFAMAMLATALFLATYMRAPWHLVLLWGFLGGRGRLARSPVAAALPSDA